MTTFLQKTFLLGAVVASAVSASDCSNMGGFRVGIGLGVANGVSTQKVNTVGSDTHYFATGQQNSTGNAINALLAAPDTGTPAATWSTGQTANATGGWIGKKFAVGFNPGHLIDNQYVSGFPADELYNALELDPNVATIGSMSRKANLGKVGLAGALNLEYWMYVGGSALVGFGIDIHNGTGYMNGAKDSPALVNSGSLPISTKIKTVWGVTPKLMFGWQLAPRTMLTFSVGASIDKYKTQSTVSGIILENESFTTASTPVANIIAVENYTGPQFMIITGSSNGILENASAQKFNKTKVGIQLGLGMRTIVAPNVELMIEGKATFGKAIKLTDPFNKALNPSFDTTTGVLTKTNFPWQSMTQKFTVQKYELLVGVAYKFGGSDKASAAA